MRASPHDELAREVDGLIDELGRSRASLVPILMEIQQRRSRGALGLRQAQPEREGQAQPERESEREIFALVAERLRLSPAEVAGVASFYSFLGTQQRGRSVVRLCRSISCDLCEKDRIARELETLLGIRFGETTADGTFTLEWTNCIGMCDQGPALLVDGELHARVTPEKARELLDQCRARAALETPEVHR